MCLFESSSNNDPPSSKHLLVSHSTMSVVWKDPLVTDVWQAIASYMKSPDLTELCRTSSHFLEIFRPLLYRNLELYFDWRYTDLTIKLLCSHKSLASHVRSFTMHAPDGPDTREIIRNEFPDIEVRFLGALGKMISLNEIIMDRSMFASADEERGFMQRLRDSDIPLKSFKFTADFSGPEEELSDSMMLSNLTTFTWAIGVRKGEGE